MLARSPRSPVQVNTKHTVRGLLSATPLFDRPLYFLRHKRPTKGRRAQGIRYEEKVTAELEERFPNYISSLPFRLLDASGTKLVVPDGLFIFPHEVIVVEVKLTHIYSAYYELTHTYSPVVSFAFKRPVRVLEVCKNYNPAQPFPGHVMVTNSIGKFISASVPVGVLLWR